MVPVGMRVVVPMMIMAVAARTVTVMMMPFRQRAFATVSTTFRIERPLHVVHMSAEPDHHVLEHMVRLNVDRAARDFRWRVPVADVPGDAGQG